jgi:hypothetical protein
MATAPSALRLNGTRPGNAIGTKKPPVFIVGSPRSGTTLLYHMLLSSGGFAVYLTESRVFDMVFPQSGDLGTSNGRRKALDIWLQSKLFTLSGLDREAIEQKILKECRNGGDFLRFVMDAIADSQNVDRWADNTPEHILYLAAIKKEIPKAKVIHMLRDGRDVALSLDKKGWISPFAWDKSQSFLVAGLYWEWIVGKGRSYGRTLGSDYLEVHYEELATRPSEALARIGGFIDHDLDYERIQQVGMGSVGEPNTSFAEESNSGSFNPVGRWQKGLPREQLAALERLIGQTLEDLGYSRMVSDSASSGSAALGGMRTLYRGYWDSKLWLKTQTPLPRILGRTGPADL